jgi:preprotein translocase subunit Sec61beta
MGCFWFTKKEKEVKMNPLIEIGIIIIIVLIMIQIFKWYR